ncbi:hypothetical protein ASZ78_003090 [Callipepla squamata]|uniref:Proteasome activator Blm10 mid region domain-containing protein n=1 Tax=Callipepla squamata TaxID=9009 RepID=A0A226MIF3_CALSU|nr:hypothetical protein ASZ78_003090 [Callipepla squamata]
MELPPPPQKEIVYNKLLPYSERLEDEAARFLAQIKGNLARAVQLQELWPGGLFWTRKLSTYIRLYGRKFSKEDHVLFIKLLYELVTIPKLEISMMQGFARLLINLLKKKELLSRDDLELPWRPLCEMLERILYSKTEHLGLNWFPNSVESVLKTLVKSCRPYFPEDATAEMLDEWRPLMCPFDVTMQKAITYFELFLPTTLPPELHHKGFKLNKELCSPWPRIPVGYIFQVKSSVLYLYALLYTSHDQHLVNLFARLATDNIGYIDWDPYVPKIFTRILRSLNLPVGSNQVVVPRFLTNAYDVGHAVMWITAMMGGPSKLVQKHLSGLFNSIASFYHPSNNGRWLNKLMKLLQRLPSSVVRRLHRERYKKPTWLTPVPDSHKLTDQDITDFVECIIQPVLLAMFSKTGSLEAAQALQNLALMRPELVIPPVLEKTYPALETLTEPHQLTATLSCVIGVARSLVSGGKWFPEGPTHMLPLLMRALPGVDPNDFSKCMVERELCSATAEFEDFVLQFIDRCFGLIESSTLEQTREETETEKMTHLESLVELGLSSTFSTVLTQCSKDIFKVALEKVFNFAVSNIFETRVAGRMVADMCRAAVKCRPEESLKLFVPHCCNVITHLTVNDDVLHDEELDKELLWNLQLLSEDWGKPGDLWNLDIQWHVPSSEEINFAFYLLDTFLQPELTKLEHYATGKLEMSRDDVQQCLAIVHNCLIGSGNILPPLKGERVAHLVPSLVSLEETKLYTGVEYDLSRENYRETIARVTRKLLRYILDNSEDDTKSLFLIIKIIIDVLQFQGSHKHEFDSRWKSFNLVKKSMENRGALYCLLGNHSGVCLANLHDWDCIAQTWPAIVSSGLSQAMSLEKPSIVRLFDDLAEKIHRQYETIGLDFAVPEKCIEVAVMLQRSEHPSLNFAPLSSEEIQLGVQRQKEKNAEALRNYENLVNMLLDCVEQRNLPWKFEHISIGFLSLLLRDDRILPVRAIRFFVQCLNHDAIVVRKVAISAVAGVLKQLKRAHKKVPICPYEISGNPKPSSIQAGDRLDNQWLHYDSQSLPKTKEAWESCCFVEKTHWGYYTWPQTMTVYAPVEQQPKLGRRRDELTEAEQIIYDHFSDPKFVEQLIKFLSLEDRKGKDKFNPRRFCLFKGLFRNFDDAFLPVLQPHLERLVSDSHESTQRCVAEIIAGLIRGSKHWTFEKESRDPRKLHWLFELLLESPLSGEGGSFVDACRLYVLQGGLAQQEWRVPELLHRLLKYLEPKLTQVYKNVRERIGSVLTYIFMIDVSLPNTAATKSPRVHEFTTRILENLKPLMEADEEIQNHVMEENGVGEQDERTQGIKLLKTILKWLMASAGRSFSTAVTEQLQLLPLFFKIAPVENDNSYDELKRDAKMCLSLMSQGLLYPQQVPLVLQVLKQTARSNSWHARYTILTYLQTMVFYNLFIFLNNEEAVNDIRWLVIKLLEDEQLEVREMAATTLSGLLQCNFLTMDGPMQTHFEQLCKMRLPKKRKRDLGSVVDTIPSGDLVKRHAGVLGLSACILSSPYDVPTWMPQLLMDLSAHLNDPQPIESISSCLRGRGFVSVFLYLIIPMSRSDFNEHLWPSLNADVTRSDVISSQNVSHAAEALGNGIPSKKEKVTLNLTSDLHVPHSVEITMLWGRALVGVTPRRH